MLKLFLILKTYILKPIKYFIIDLLVFYPKNETIFYGGCRNTTNKFRLIIKNIIQPQRILFIYRIFKHNPKVDVRLKLSGIYQDHIKTLHDQGAVIVSKFLNPALCDDLISKYSDDSVIEKIIVDKLDNSKTRYRWPQITKDIEEFFTNDDLLNLARSYFRRDVYASTYPYFHHINPQSDSPQSKDIKALSQFNSSWHYDVPLGLVFYLLLKDMDKKGSHTKYLAGTHKLPNNHLSGDDRCLSDEYVKQQNLDVLDLYGKKGDLLIFDLNGFHKLHRVKGQDRHALVFSVSCGGRVEMNCEKMHNALKSGFTPGNLIPEKAKYTSSLFPCGPHYDFSGTSFLKSINIY